MKQIKSITVAEAKEIMNELKGLVTSTPGEQTGPLVFFSPSNPERDRSYWFPFLLNPRPRLSGILTALKYFTVTLKDYKWLEEWGIEIEDELEAFLFPYFPKISRCIKNGGYGAILIKVTTEDGLSVTPLPNDYPPELVFSEWISPDGTLRAERWNPDDVYKELKRLEKFV